MASSRASQPTLTFHPWLVFGVFLLANVLLSYSSLGVQAKLWIGFFGLVLPFFLAARVPSPRDRNPLYLREFLPPIPWWVWVLLGATAVFLRFYKLTTLSAWPMPDDGMYASFALGLSEGLYWKFFLSDTQVPVASFWILSFFYKFFSPSLFTIWFVPAVISSLTLLAFHRAVRTFFPGSFGLALFVVGAFNFGVLYTGRFYMHTVVVLFWISLTLSILAAWFQKDPSGRPAGGDWLLGSVTGAGFFIAILWPAVAVPVAVAVVEKQHSRTHSFPWGFWVPLTGCATAYYLLFFWYRGGGHIQDLWAFHAGMDGFRQLHDSLCNFAALFWGTGIRISYGPVWGGILNPFLSSFFFLGFLEILRGWRQPVLRWMAFFFLSGLTPGLLSKNYDFFRDLGCLFPMFFIAALGLQRCLASFLPWKKIWAAWFLGLVLTTSCALDLYHLTGPYHQTWGTPGPYWESLKSADAWRAYGILEKRSQESGPGMVLANLRPSVTEQTLSLACYPFDACRNPRIAFADARWAAVLVHPDYKPFLQKKFPSGKWYWLGKGLVWDDLVMLAVLPLENSNSDLLRRWFEVDKRLQPLVFQAIDLPSGGSQEPMVRRLLEVEKGVPQDPFIETCLWEKIVFHRMSMGDGPGVLESLRQGLRKGYPLAHLYNLEGVLLSRMGRSAEARIAFEKALQAPLNLTPARQNLKDLGP